MTALSMELYTVMESYFLVALMEYSNYIKLENMPLVCVKSSEEEV